MATINPFSMTQMTTWLAIGASLQIIFSALLPIRVAVAPAILLLIGRSSFFVVTRNGMLHDSSLDQVRLGRFSTQIPLPDGSFSPRPSDQEVVVMILGVQFNHTDGRFAPGVRPIGQAVFDMWTEASRNREKWGFLGETETLLTTNRNCGNTRCWISYWKSVDHLLAFAHGEAHRKGWDLFNEFNRTQKHVGLMHELYVVPKGCWETMYHNYEPFGFGQTMHVTEKRRESGETVSSLRDFRGRSSVWQTAEGRMGRVEQ